MALFPPVRNTKIVKVIEGAHLKNSKLLIQLKKPVQVIRTVSSRQLK